MYAQNNIDISNISFSSVILCYKFVNKNNKIKLNGSKSLQNIEKVPQQIQLFDRSNKMCMNVIINYNLLSLY